MPAKIHQVLQRILRRIVNKEQLPRRPKQSLLSQRTQDASEVIQAGVARTDNYTTRLAHSFGPALNAFFRIFRRFLSRAEIEFSKEEEDSDSEIVEGTKAASIGLYGLDAGIKVLSGRIGKAVMMIVKQIEQMTLKHLGRCDHWLEPASALHAHTTARKSSELYAQLAYPPLAKLRHMKKLVPPDCLHGLYVRFQET
jgi:hypothetical protein